MSVSDPYSLCLSAEDSLGRQLSWIVRVDANTVVADWSDRRLLFGREKKKVIEKKKKQFKDE